LKTQQSQRNPCAIYIGRNQNSIRSKKKRERGTTPYRSCTIYLKNILASYSQVTEYETVPYLKIKPKFYNQFLVLLRCFVQVAIMKLQECKSKQFQAHNLYKKRKSIINQSSNFGLIEESMELSGILLAITIRTRKCNKRILA